MIALALQLHKRRLAFSMDKIVCLTALLASGLSLLNPCPSSSGAATARVVADRRGTTRPWYELDDETPSCTNSDAASWSCCSSCSSLCSSREITGGQPLPSWTLQWRT